MRDALIAQIYEGTNGVQAMDLLGRKVPEGNGRLVTRFVGMVQRDLEAASSRPELETLSKDLGTALQLLAETTRKVMARAQQDPDEVGAAAVDYLRFFGLVATGWMWVRMAALSETKRATAHFYVAKLLPQTRSLAAQIDAGAKSVVALDL